MEQDNKIIVVGDASELTMGCEGVSWENRTQPVHQYGTN